MSLARRTGHQAPPPIAHSVLTSGPSLLVSGRLSPATLRTLSEFQTRDFFIYPFQSIQVMMMMINDGLSSKLLFCQVAVSMKTPNTSLSREGVSLGGSRPLLRVLGRTRASVPEQVFRTGSGGWEKLRSVLRVARLLSSRAWTLPRRVLECGMSRVGTSFPRGETNSSDHLLHTGLTGEESLNLSWSSQALYSTGCAHPCHPGSPSSPRASYQLYISYSPEPRPRGQ